MDSPSDLKAILNSRDLLPARVLYNGLDFKFLANKKLEVDVLSNKALESLLEVRNQMKSGLLGKRTPPDIKIAKISVDNLSDQSD